MPDAKQIATCICCSPVALCTPCCIDAWWGTEACGLSCLSFGKCCWMACAPICLSGACGDAKASSDYCF